jgi:hypothetical protein
MEELIDLIIDNDEIGAKILIVENNLKIQTLFDDNKITLKFLKSINTEKEFIERISLLLDLGYNINNKMNYGDRKITLLEYCEDNEYSEVIRYLIRQ